MTQYSGHSGADRPADNGAIGGGSLGVDPLVKSSRRRLIERATIAGLGISILVHLVLLVIAVLVRVDYKFADAGGGESEPVEFAILSQADLNEQTAVDVEEIEFAEIETESVVDLDLLSDVGAQQSVSDLADSIAPELMSGGSAMSSVDSMTGASGAGTGEGASFFGLEASGQRFAYIVDRSSSMDTLIESRELSRWELTQIELIRSVHGLSANSEFYVMLYSSESKPLFSGSAWIKANQNNKNSAAFAMMSEFASGGTYPIESFRSVLTLDPKPDAVYFMTDGEFGEEIPGEVARMNGKRRVPIHCILMGEPGTPEKTRRVEGMLQSIARSSRGQYRHVRDSGGAQP